MSDISVTEPALITVRVDLALHPTLRDPRLGALEALARSVVGGVGADRSRPPQVAVHDIWWFAFPAQGTNAAERALAIDSIVGLMLLDAANVVVKPAYPPAAATEVVIEVGLRSGVTDTVSATFLAELRRRFPPEVCPVAVTTGRHIWLGFGGLEIDTDAFGAFANPAIERRSVNQPLEPAWQSDEDSSGRLTLSDVMSMNDEGLAALSVARRLSLDLAEMQAIRAYFQAQARPATDVELETIAQTWSEHCKHKTFRAKIDYAETGADGHVTHRVIDGLLPTCFAAVTAKLARPYVRSAFADNAGVVAFDDAYDLAIKVETHNRPSAIEPFGGANTGMGGVLRDIMGVSARPFAATDVLFFGPSDYPVADLPAGVLHPAQVRDGVVRGIGDYGNKMGIPTVAGGVRFDPAYVTNPLVFAGAVGIVPRGAHPTQPRVGDLIVVAGGATGRDGLRGATFSSVSMDATTSVVSGGAVQIGDPIMQKRVLDFQLEARDAKLYSAVTDCGAGGLSSAVGELADHLGAEVELADVPSKYSGLAPWELWLSEAQERMVLAVPPENLAELQRLAARRGCPVAVIGAFTATGRLRVSWQGQVVADLELEFLHRGLPQRTLKAVWAPPAEASKPLNGKPKSGPIDEESIWAPVLAHLRLPNGRLAREILATYDTEVQGGTLARPVVGPTRLGAGDGVVVMPFEVQHLAEAPSAIIGIGFCPELTRQDPRMMAWRAIDEAIRNAVAVGADPDQLCLLDNFAWGDTHDPQELGALVRTAEACAEAAVFYGAPFVSGKDSLHNAWTLPDGTRRSIPGTLVVTALGILPAGQRPCTSDFKQAGDLIALVGGLEPSPDGRPHPDTLKLYRALFQAHRQGLFTACHDVSSGGVLATIAEMALGGGLGALLGSVTPDLALAFVGEGLRCAWPGRFVVAFSAADQPGIVGLFRDLPVMQLGQVTLEPYLSLSNTTLSRLTLLGLRCE